MSIIAKKANPAEIDTPATGKVSLYVDCNDGKIKVKDSNGCVKTIATTEDKQEQYFGDGSCGCCVISENTTLPAGTYNFSDLIICDGVSLCFCGNDNLIIKVCNCFCNMGILCGKGTGLQNCEGYHLSLGGLDLFNKNLLPYRTFSLSAAVAGGGICGAGDAHGGCATATDISAGNGLTAGGGGGGSPYTVSGRKYYGCNGGAGDLVNGIGGAGGCGGRYNSNNGTGGGGGRGLICGGSGGVGNRGGDGGDGVCCKGGNGGDTAAWGTRGGDGGNSCYGTGGNGGILCGCTGCGGDGGYSIYGTGGNGGGGNNCSGGRAGHGGDGYQGGDGGNSSYCQGGNGGSSHNVAYGINIFAKCLYNKCIDVHGNNGGDGGRGGNDWTRGNGGNGADGGNVLLIYSDYICLDNSSTQPINNFGGAGGTGGTAGANGNNGFKYIIKYNE